MEQQTTSIEDILRNIIREEFAVLRSQPQKAPSEDGLLTAAEASKILHVSARWLYRHADKLPYAVRLSPTVVRFSRNRIQAEIQRKLKMQSNT